MIQARTRQPERRRTFASQWSGSTGLDWSRRTRSLQWIGCLIRCVSSGGTNALSMAKQTHETETPSRTNERRSPIKHCVLDQFPRGLCQYIAMPIRPCLDYLHKKSPLVAGSVTLACTFNGSIMSDVLHIDPSCQSPQNAKSTLLNRYSFS